LDKRIQLQKGFTLIEILIVVILIGILATIIVPYFINSTEDAKLNTLKNNLHSLRTAIELYYNQHGNMYPAHIRLAGGGLQNKNGEYFSNQLTRYTSVDGVVSDIKDSTYKFGPYIKGGALPNNPYIGNNLVRVNHVRTDITWRNVATDNGWKFYGNTGILIANDDDHFEL
jgi:prepilin-type N-terminal cleavage/methylation domain-containing protein